MPGEGVKERVCEGDSEGEARTQNTFNARGRPE